MFLNIDKEHFILSHISYKNEQLRYVQHENYHDCDNINKEPSKAAKTQIANSLFLVSGVWLVLVCM